MILAGHLQQFCNLTANKISHLPDQKIKLATLFNIKSRIFYLTAVNIYQTASGSHTHFATIASESLKWQTVDPARGPQFEPQFGC